MAPMLFLLALHRAPSGTAEALELKQPGRLMAGWWGRALGPGIRPGILLEFRIMVVDFCAHPPQRILRTALQGGFVSIIPLLQITER